MRHMGTSSRLSFLLGALITLVMAWVDPSIGIGFGAAFALCMAYAGSHANAAQGGYRPGQPDRRRDTRRPAHAMRQGTEIKHPL